MLTPEQARRLASLFGAGLDGRSAGARSASDDSPPAPCGAVEVVIARRTDEGIVLLTEPVPDGVSILAHARRLSLDDRARLALHAEACSLVATAHAQGVLHRDLRPSNVLVDASGSVVIVRFGGDNAGTGEDVSDAVATTVTQLAEAMRYLSPEQCAGPADAVDARCDVYALGVILYELLCRRPPLDLEGATLTRAMEIVRAVPPEPPSRHRPDLVGPAEQILLRALEKDASRRQETVAALERDVRDLIRTPDRSRRQRLR